MNSVLIQYQNRTKYNHICNHGTFTTPIFHHTNTNRSRHNTNLSRHQSFTKPTPIFHHTNNNLYTPVHTSLYSTVLYSTLHTHPYTLQKSMLSTPSTPFTPSTPSTLLLLPLLHLIHLIHLIHLLLLPLLPLLHLLLLTLCSP